MANLKGMADEAMQLLREIAYNTEEIKSHTHDMRIYMEEIERVQREAIRRG